MSFTEPVTLWNIIVEVLPLLIAFGAVWVAVQSVRETRRGINAQILLQYKEEYGSKEIHEGMKLITRFLDDEEIKDTFLENFSKMRRQPDDDFILDYAVDTDGKVGKGSKTVYVDEIRGIDNTRRRISHRFTTLKILEKTESLNRDFIIDMVSTKEIEFYLDYVDKLDRAMIEDKEYDRTTRDYVKELEKDKKN